MRNKSFKIRMFTLILSLFMGQINALANTTMTEDGSNESAVLISAMRNSNVVISIPKRLTLTGDEGVLTVSIKGDTAGIAEIVVGVTKTLNMRQTGKDTVSGTTILSLDSSFNTTLTTESHNQLYWQDTATYSQISSNEGYKLYCKATTDTALTAGDWSGNLGVRISVTNSEQTAGLYTAEGIFYSWQALKTIDLIDTDGDGVEDAPAIYVSDTGVLTTNYDSATMQNYNNEFMTGTLVIDKEVKEIGDYGLALCENLKAVTLPDGLQKIGNRGFYVCRNAVSINLPDTIQNIGPYAFYSCINLKYIHIPSSLTSIPDGAFRYCTHTVGTIDIPQSVTSIGEQTFEDVMRVQTIFIPDNVTSIGNSAFSNVPKITLENCPLDEVANSNWGALSASRQNNIAYLDRDELERIAAGDLSTNKQYIQWKYWENFKEGNYLSGLIDTNLLSDRVYMSMKLPSENTSYMSYRINPEIADYKTAGKDNMCGIGAVYKVVGEELPETFNVCIGKFSVYVLLDSEDAEWQVFDDHTPLNKKEYFQLRPLPWTDNSSSLDENRVDENKTIYHDNYVEFTFTNEDLTTNSVLHFYGAKNPFVSENLRALVVIYDVWTDSEEAAYKLCADSGADQRYQTEDPLQVFWSKNYDVTTEVRTVIGHAIPDDVYAELVREGKSPEQALRMFESTKPIYNR